MRPAHTMHDTSDDCLEECKGILTVFVVVVRISVVPDKAPHYRVSVAADTCNQGAARAPARQCLRVTCLQPSEIVEGDGGKVPSLFDSGSVAGAYGF